MGAAFLFSTLRRDRAELLQITRANLKREPHGAVRATMLFSLAVLGKGKVAKDEALFTSALASPIPLEQLAGVVGLARLRPLHPGEQQALVSLRSSTEGSHGCPWVEEDLGALARHVAAAVLGAA